MKEAHPLVNDAYRLVRKKRYRDAVPVLEKVTSSRPSDPYPYFLLACAYLHSGELARVELLVKRSRSLRQDYLPALELEAFLLLKSSAETGPVVSRYLDIAQRYPKDRTVKRAIETLREQQDFSTLQRGARFARFVDIPAPATSSPRNTARSPRRTRPRLKLVLIVAAAVIVAALIGTLSYIFRDAIRTLVETRLAAKSAASVPDYESMTPDRSWGDLVDKSRRAEVVYASQDEVARDFNSAKQLMKDEKYNDALRRINRLLNGTTALPVRERADFLRSFILGIKDRKPERIAFNELSARPYLFNGCMVALKGAVADLRKGQGKTTFSLVVPKTSAAQPGVVDVYYLKDDQAIVHGETVDVTGVFMSATAGARIFLDARTVEGER